MQQNNITFYNVRVQALAAASMKLAAFWDLAPCSLIGVDRLFRGDHPDDGGSTHL
jgi:hypothetical protein